MKDKLSKFFSMSVLSTIFFGLIGFFISVIKDITDLKAEVRHVHKREDKVEKQIDKIGKQIDEIHWHFIRKNK